MKAGQGLTPCWSQNSKIGIGKFLTSATPSDHFGTGSGLGLALRLVRSLNISTPKRRKMSFFTEPKVENV